MNLIANIDQFVFVAVYNKIYRYEIVHGGLKLITGSLLKLRFEIDVINFLTASSKLLMAVTEQAKLYIFDSELMITRQVLECDESAWGVAFSDDLVDIFVSTNSHKVTRFHLNASNGLYEYAQQYTGHLHNIPSIYWSNGKLYSASIDTTIRCLESYGNDELSLLAFPSSAFFLMC